jgi:DeoR family fructose operon transcriptional repressor
MLPEERRTKILSILHMNKSATVTYLCNELKASEATIRRDLVILDDENKLERVRGGAIMRSNTPVEKEETFGEKEGAYIREKQRIAKEAFKHLRDHDSIFLDAGTTTLELAKLIGRSRIHVFVATNAPHFSMYLANNPNVEQFVVGGKIRNNTLSVVGAAAVDMIRRLNMNKVFIGVNAISPEFGLTTPDFEEAELKRHALDNGRERFILADSSKFSKVAMCEIAPLSYVDMIITSTIEDESIRSECEKEGITLVEVLRDWEG